MGPFGMLAKEKYQVAITWIFECKNVGCRNITTTKNEGCKDYPNKTNSIQEWNAKRVLVALVPK
jgi:hypothetical protein